MEERQGVLDRPLDGGGGGAHLLLLVRQKQVVTDVQQVIELVGHAVVLAHKAALGVAGRDLLAGQELEEVWRGGGGAIRG